jgi:hypothetical protein
MYDEFKECYDDINKIPADERVYNAFFISTKPDIDKYFTPLDI